MICFTQTNLGQLLVVMFQLSFYCYDDDDDEDDDIVIL